MAIKKAAAPLPKSISQRNLADLDVLLRAMRGRYASNDMDRVYAIAFPFMRHASYVNEHIYLLPRVRLPLYDANTPIPVAWGHLISSIASTELSFCDIPQSAAGSGQPVLEATHTPTIQLLRLFPHPSRDHWFPSWAQIQQYPDVSVRDVDSVRVPEDTEYSLQIQSGRIYRDCTLQLIQPSTPETKAIYLSTMDGKDAQLVATVQGIEPHITSGSRYVLVDINPDNSLWPTFETQLLLCENYDIGHEHHPIWQTSVILVCEEVDKLPQLEAERAAERATECSTSIMRYRLRRVTTLERDCTQSVPGLWLPFKPTLVHLRSVACSAKGGRDYIAPLVDLINEDAEKYLDEDEDEDLDIAQAIDAAWDALTFKVFCDPEAVAGLLGQGEFHKDWRKWLPGYEVYLV